MKTITIAAIAAMLGIGAANAQDTTVIKTRSDTGTTVKKKVVRTDGFGCKTKTVKRTNDMGDSVTKTKSSC
jgi:hypothetical protein